MNGVLDVEAPAPRLSGTPGRAIQKFHRPREIRIDGRTLTTTPAFDAYWYFAAARQEIFFARFSNENSANAMPCDDILRNFRFTNAYRASDRVSQYLIREVIGPSSSTWSHEDLFFRIILFKIFNKIETWEALESEFGMITLDRFNAREFDRFLADRQDAGVRNYSAAYIMPSAGRAFGHDRKHSNHLALLQWMIDGKFPERLNRMEHMADGYELMCSAPSLGPFLAYQFVTDLNYSPLTSFSEMEFVIAGPGALDGLSKCFEGVGRVPTENIIAHMATHQTDYFAEFGYHFRDLWGRPLQLIDCQNLFCEISKYTRVAFPEISGVSGRTRIKQKYSRSGRPVEKPLYPEKWGLNARINVSCTDNGPHRPESRDYHRQASLF